MPWRGRLARWGVGILPTRRRERDAPETAGKMPALRTSWSIYFADLSSSLHISCALFESSLRFS